MRYKVNITVRSEKEWRSGNIYVKNNESYRKTVGVGEMVKQTT